MAGVYAEGFPVDVADKFWQTSQQQLFLIANVIFWRTHTPTITLYICQMQIFINE